MAELLAYLSIVHNQFLQDSWNFTLTLLIEANTNSQNLMKTDLLQMYYLLST